MIAYAVADADDILIETETADVDTRNAGGTELSRSRCGKKAYYGDE